MTYRKSWWLTATVAAALQGCTGVEIPTADRAPAEAPYQYVAEMPPPEPIADQPKKKPPAKKAARPRPKPATQLASTQPQAGVTEAEHNPATPDLPPVNLVGLDEEQLAALFGAPSEQEEPAPGKVLRYRRGTCTIDITLFPDVVTHTYRSLAYEVTSDDNTAEGKRACVPQQHVNTARQ